MFAVIVMNTPSVKCLHAKDGGLESGRAVHALCPREVVTFGARTRPSTHSKSPVSHMDDSPSIHTPSPRPIKSRTTMDER